MTNKPEAPKNIWLRRAPTKDYFSGWDFTITWAEKQEDDTDIKYIRADRYTALLDAAVSLHHWLFELVKTYDDGIQRSYEREMLDDVQLALDKWNRFLDGD